MRQGGLDRSLPRAIPTPQNRQGIHLEQVLIHRDVFIEPTI